MKEDHQLKNELASTFRKVVKEMSALWSRHIDKSLSMAQFMVLRQLRGGPQKVSDLAEALELTSGAITAKADKLVEKGYAKRYRGEDDRRVVYLEMTERGLSELKALGEQQTELVESLFAGLSEEEIRQHLRFFNRMLNNMEQLGEE